jgi:hypothetical protein
MGITVDDWRKIRVAAIEVHDLSGRVETIKQLLASHGLTEQQASQEALFEGTNVWTVVAARPAD